MKSYVIAITDFEPSMKSADRCIDSAKKFGIDVSIFDAITPSKNPLGLLKSYEISETDFDTPYSRKINATCCFLSHYSLWMKSVEDNESYLIFEHDAVMVDKFDMNVNFNMLLSIGRPSYGKYNTPKVGINPLTSKSYLPGAHAYVIKPAGAKELVKHSKIAAAPTDVYINIKTFPWIQELYPWPAICDDSFTTVQVKKGCEAKHNYNNDFRIIYE